jgi:hypothetical protein
MSFKQFEARKIYNDVIDEVIELEDEDKQPEEIQIDNDQIDEEINVSDDSDNYIPTPRENDQSSDEYQETENNTQRIYNKKEDEDEFGQDTCPNKQQKETQLEALNLDEETKDIFKYIKVNSD